MLFANSDLKRYRWRYNDNEVLTEVPFLTMGSSLWYADSIQNITPSHKRYSKIIGVLWAIFTVCYLVISSTAFFAPEWIALEGHNFGKIGLWSVCTEGEQNQICFGKLENFMSFPGRSFQAATIFAGLAVFSAVLTVCAMLFFLCCHSSTVFFTCAWMQLFSGICMVAGCVTFPLGWSEEVVQTICLNSEQFVLGHCEFRLGFLLAIVAILDAFVLCVLAFIQASQYSNLKIDSTTSYQGEFNTHLGDSISINGSGKSLNLHPVYLMHPGQEDDYSQFSNRTVPRTIQYSRGHLPYSAHNFHM